VGLQHVELVLLEELLLALANLLSAKQLVG